MRACVRQVEDLVWCGHLDQYEEAYDKLTTRTARALQKIENKVLTPAFYERLHMN